MTTYNPPSFPRRPKRSNLFTETRYHLQLAYYRYEINTALYVMSPGEKFAFNMVVFSVLLLLFSAFYYYLPRTTVIGMRRMGYYITGSHKIHVNGEQMAQGVLQSSGNAAASLTDHGATANASGVFVP